MRHKFPFLFIALLLGLLIAPVGKAGAVAPNLIQDPSLEAAYSSTAIWQQASTNSDTPLCIASDNDCAFPGISAPRTGSIWAVFGGVDWSDEESISPEVGDLYQNVVFPTCGASLQFYFWIGAAPAGSDANDVFNVKIDGVTVFLANATQQSSYPSYTLVNLNVSAYANGAVHKVEFYSVTDGQMVTFNVDDISLTQTCVTISGNAGVAGATLNSTGGSAIADGSGNYSFNVPFEWSGTVTPSKSGYVFSPVSRTYSNITTNQTAQNYTATAVYLISGNVGVGGVTLSYTDGTPKTATSVSNGDYSFPVTNNWSGTVTPSHICFTFNPTNRTYSNVTADQTSQNYTPIVGPGCANIDVLIGGSNVGNYGISSEESIFDRYGINGGPVHVVSTNGITPIFTSQRAKFGNSFNSIVGYPGDQLTTDYWFTSYDDLGMITYLVIGNPDPALTAEVDVFIAGNKMNATPYSIAPGQRIFPRYGINGGPVHVVSTNGVNIFTSERTKFGNSFNEVLGYPGDQLTTEYWFTSYDDLGMITYLVIGNPDPALTAEVDVFIAGNKMNATPYSIAPGQRIFPRYGINGGPVHVVSTNGVNIFTSERTKFGNSFNEVLGYPGDQLTTEYWFTSYDDLGMITYLVIGNPDPALTAEVDVYIDGVKKNATPYLIAPGQRVFPRYAINGGPVHVISTNGVDIFTSERAKYLSSFNEILGIANNQLTTDYWFTSYDDLGMTTYLVIAAP